MFGSSRVLSQEEEVVCQIRPLIYIFQLRIAAVSTCFRMTTQVGHRQLSGMPEVYVGYCSDSLVIRFRIDDRIPFP